ncbi:uncharacterized protein LOC106535970 [Austrofundulus limnaeus]|uniref:Uncharacterized protein LOC106535970 n=1 Tax=Austrofundulus limnaeus TaxID=52670 RepID=A0A2I4D8K4_AUSLI|nr:PREDICTED: uncharacterized protein LOC106535970 [Austrofundulus limnaeus]
MKKNKERKRQGTDEYLLKYELFKSNAFVLINKMIQLCNKTHGSQHLVDEICYSIFFFGQIFDPNGNLNIYPKDIFGDDQTFIEKLSSKYNKPFEYFHSQTSTERPLPRRSPFSCVLDMFVLQNGPEDEIQIRKSLEDLVNELKDMNLNLEKKFLDFKKGEPEENKQCLEFKKDLDKKKQDLDEKKKDLDEKNKDLDEKKQDMEVTKNKLDVKNENLNFEKECLDLEKKNLRLEKEIWKKKDLDLRREKKLELVSTVICVSKYKNSEKHYGVSMSTTSLNAGRIVIAASCLSGYWNKYVADAVMTYYPEQNQKKNEKKKKKDYFDGTFKLPESISCKAYHITKRTEMNPCISCRNLFGLKEWENNLKEWENNYGNCAEAECLSNLLLDVSLEIKPEQHTYNPEDRENARASVETVLKNTLKTVHFKWNGEYYPPQTQRP